jgi:hypothetical protein
VVATEKYKRRDLRFNNKVKRNDDCTKSQYSTYQNPACLEKEGL